MRFVFFNAQDKIVFTRDDAERAEWTVHQLSLSLAFPYRADKVIQRGMRIGFDYLGALQLFEIRKVKTYEPDHYQEITAEHIAISELTDDHYNPINDEKFEDMTAAQVLSGVLSKANLAPSTIWWQNPQYIGSLWQVGTDTTTDGYTDTISFSLGSIWQCVNAIPTKWPVRITPRVTYDATGITGRYLDISPYDSAFRGVRLNLEKNIFEANVQIDDTNVVTAMYGYGAGNSTIWGVEWEATAEHPAKAHDSFYLEDPAATAAYGRNGRPRFGYYQNENYPGGTTTDKETLLEVVWEALKQASQPKITVDGLVRDMKRLGYADEPIMLHDKVYVELRPVGLKYELEVSALIVDLLDASNTHVTIGTYYPDIIAIQRNTAAFAKGGGFLGYGNASGLTANQNNMIKFNFVTENVQGYALGTGVIIDGNGNSQNVVTW